MYSPFHDRFRWLALVALVAVSFGPHSAFSQDDDKAELPLNRVVMFSSGVAFYEHDGKVEGNSSIDLKFNVRDVNDLLQSMVVQDLGGGHISTVSFGSKDPITRTLGTFAVNVAENVTMADLLAQIRGEEIEIEAPTKVVGTIFGIETRKQAVGDEDVVEVTYLNLLTKTGLRSISLHNVGAIRLTNEKLNSELTQALAVLAGSHATDKKKQ